MRWTPKRKAAILDAIENGVLSLVEAKAAYALSDEELTGWRRDYAANGRRGLRVTKLQLYRPRTADELVQERAISTLASTILVRRPRGGVRRQRDETMARLNREGEARHRGQVNAGAAKDLARFRP